VSLAKLDLQALPQLKPYWICNWFLKKDESSKVGCARDRNVHQAGNTPKAELYFRHMSQVLSSFLISSSSHSSKSLLFSTLNRNAVLVLHNSSWESCSLTKLRTHVETLISSRRVTIRIFVKSWQQKIEHNWSMLIIQRRARNHSQRNETDQLFTVLSIEVKFWI